MASAEVLQCLLIYFIMAEGGSYFKEDGASQFEDDLGGHIYYLMFIEFLSLFLEILSLFLEILSIFIEIFIYFS